MAASTTTPARPAEAEQAQTGLNEPSMEDILASIRRIIAEDQSNSLGRSSIGGLTRRVAAASARAAAEPVASAPLDEAVAIEAALPSAEEEAHAGPEADMLHASYDAPPEAVQSFAAERHEEPSHVLHQPEPAYETEAAFQGYADDHAAHHAPAGLALSDDGTEPLVSATTGASITSSFQALAESVVLQDPGLIERVMRESMRPLLKAWLDDHLPSIVERLVRAEIERVARGGRGRNI